MFGYARRDLIGRNINTLVPEPMSTVHQQYMLTYITTGKEASCAACVLVQCGCWLRVCSVPVRSQTVMNTTRTAFGKHIQGYIFPLLLNVKAMESSFAGIMQELKTNDNFILFTSKSLRITEATQDSMKLLGVSGAPACASCAALCAMQVSQHVGVAD